MEFIGAHDNSDVSKGENQICCLNKSQYQKWKDGAKLSGSKIGNRNVINDDNTVQMYENKTQILKRLNVNYKQTS